MSRKTIFIGLIFFSFILMNNVSAQPGNGFSVNAGGLFSLKAKADKLDPFFGGGISYQYSNFKINATIFKGKAKLEKLGDYPEIDINFDSDDILYGISIDYLFNNLLKANKGLYFGFGAGYFKENVKFEGDISVDFGWVGKWTEHFSDDLSGSSFSVEAMAGYLFNKFEVFAKYYYFVESKNVTGALSLGAGILF